MKPRLASRIFFTCSVSVRTTIPSLTRTVHAVSSRLPRGPGNSTMHIRHAPSGSSLGCEQKTGISIPAALAASTTSVPAGTDTLMSSMVTLT